MISFRCLPANFHCVICASVTFRRRLSTSGITLLSEIHRTGAASRANFHTDAEAIRKREVEQEPPASEVGPEANRLLAILPIQVYHARWATAKVSKLLSSYSPHSTKHSLRGPRVMEQDLSIHLAQAQQIIDQHFPSSDQLLIDKLVQLPNEGYSHTPDFKTYIADLIRRGDTSTPNSSCFITIARRNPSTLSVYYQNPLPLVAKLSTMIRTKTAIPIREFTLDTSQSIIPFQYLLSPPSPFPSSSIVSLPAARASGLLSKKAELSIDLLLGAFLGQLHSGVQNDWYGRPMLENLPSPPTDTGYSWQETFTGLFEGVLGQVEKDEAAYGVSLPYADIRLYLSRAIGSFLFDDVEVPSLVWFTGSEDDIYITLHSSTTSEPGTIAAMLPNIAHAIWGDPLLEAFMMGPEDKVAQGEGPSAAFMEGYKGGGGSPILVFTRQKTKRIWYSIFLALVVLTKYGPSEKEEDLWITKKRQWARETLGKAVLVLKDAPCY